MQQYLYDLNEIPAAHHSLFESLNESIKLAFAKFERGNKSLTRANGGYYLVIKNDKDKLELINIEQYIQDAPDGLHGWWIASEANDRWYSDPRKTLKELVLSITGDN